MFARSVATEFRQQFQKPVVIDMWCYRRFGHNEGDEPAFTQPLMYKKIRGHKTTLDLYGEKLVAEGSYDAGRARRRENRVARAARKNSRPRCRSSPTRRIGSTVIGRG